MKKLWKNFILVAGVITAGVLGVHLYVYASNTENMDTTETEEEAEMTNLQENSDSRYQYDNLGRLIKVTYEDESYVEYEYDANGNITNVITGNQ